MAADQTTKARYFILGLVVSLLSVPYLFQLVIPADAEQPQMWVNAHIAIVDGAFFLLLIGALGGFALSRKVLLPKLTFLTSIVMGLFIIALSVTGLIETLDLGAIVLLSFIAGLLGCWAMVEVFGKVSEDS